MKKKIAFAGFSAVVFLGAGRMASAGSFGYPWCVTRVGSEPMATAYAAEGSSCFIVNPYNGYRVWGRVHWMF